MAGQVLQGLQSPLSMGEVIPGGKISSGGREQWAAAANRGRWVQNEGALISFFRILDFPEKTFKLICSSISRVRLRRAGPSPGSHSSSEPGRPAENLSFCVLSPHLPWPLLPALFRE